MLGARQSASFEVLAEILAAGQRSRLYRALVIDKKIASFAGGGLSLSRRGPGEFTLHAWLAPGKKQTLENLKKIEEIFDDILTHLDANPISEAELARAKNRLVAETIYANDSQSQLANFAGRMMITGHRLEAITALSKHVQAVTMDDVKKAAQYMLNPSRAMSGFLLPDNKK